ncbi:MAG: ribosomal-processing cysteine protease Prp [Acholeplasmatales bacterium]|nr:ribosomal-processing cysteine protease Prp [Acholeplasmatales bacterium]
MTKYSIKNTLDLYSIEISGHAGFADKGLDIVCSAISTAIYMTRNQIEVLEPSYNLSSIKLEEGYAYFEVPKKYKNAVKILEVLEFTLNNLESQFPKHIKKLK